MTISKSKLTSKTVKLKPYCHHAKEHDFINVTMWDNGEGGTVHMSSGNQEKYFDLTYGEFEALCVVWNYKE